MAKVTVRYGDGRRTDRRSMSVEMSDSSARLIESLAIKLALLDENVVQACEPLPRIREGM